MQYFDSGSRLSSLLGTVNCVGSATALFLSYAGQTFHARPSKNETSGSFLCDKRVSCLHFVAGLQGLGLGRAPFSHEPGKWVRSHQRISRPSDSGIIGAVEQPPGTCVFIFVEHV